nr:hypothetical protein [bacterium]
GGISNISEITYNLAPLSTATGVIIGSLSGESVSADITSSLLSSLTLTYLLTCDNALSNHAITGTVTTDAGTASISGSIDTTGNTYTGIVSVEQYPVSIPAYSLLTIPVTGATWKDTSTSYSILSNFSTVGGTLSSTSLTYLLTSENVTGHEVQGVLTSNAMTVSNISPVNVTGTISTTGNNYTMELSSTPISSHIDTSPVISAFPRKELNIGRGYTYTFILTTPWPNFDTFKLSTSQDGEHTGGEEYITNVAGFEGSAPGDEIRLKVTPETPSTLYYYSSLTPDAGSVINITDACSIADDGSFVTDASTAPVTDKQTIASKRPKVKFIFNNQDLSDLELFNDTKYTFFVNNSSDSTFSFNNETGDDASLGSPRQVSNNRTTQGVVTFAKQTNRSAITINNNQETGGGSSFKGSIGDTEVKTTTPPAASETGDVANTNITSPPGATAPDYAKVSVDCEAEELFRNIPHGTTYKIPIYSRTRTNVYTYVQSRTWEYPEWTFVGELTSARAGSSLTFTSSAEGRDPIAVNGSGTLNEATYTYTWDGTASNSEGLTGRGSATIGLNPNGGETGAIYGTWDTRYNDMPVVSGTDSWSLESTSFTAVPASAVSVSPTPGDYKARYAFSLHDIFTTETEPLVVSHGNRYDHESKIVIGPTDNDITIFTASEIYSNGVLFYDKNNSKAFLPIDSSADGNGINVIPRDKLIDTVKAGEVMTVYLSGSDGQNLWSAGVLAYLETVCLNTFDLKNINVDEVAYNEQTFNAGTSLDANISNALSAVSGSAMALTLTHIPGEIEGSHYKWYRGTDVIPGAIAATLNIPLFTINDNGNYSVSIETPYRFKQSQPVTITAHTFTEALAALIVEYDFATTYGITAGSGHLWTTPLMNVQIWRCVHTADNTLSAVQHVVNEDIAIEPYTDGRADVRMELSASTDTFLNGGTSELSALTGNALNWHFAANNANGTPLITLSGTPDDRLTDNINYGVLANNTPWNDASDAPIIENADSVFVVLMSTPVTGANPTFPILDGGQASIVPGDSATYTHFISQTGYKTTPGLTALNLSALQFTADTLTGAPLGRAYDYVFGYQPWSHHSSVSGIGLSGSTGNTKIIGLTGFNADGGYYTNGSTVSATFLSLKSKSTYTYLTATSTYAITGDDVYPDTTFHMSTRPALSGSVNIDIYNGNAYDSALNHKIRLYELMPTGVLSEDNWMVTREVIDWSGISWGMSQFNTSSLHTTAAVCHPFTESLTANTTGKVRYLYIDEYDGDVYESNDTQHDEIRSITIQTYTDTGDNRNGSTGAGGGDALPTWWYRTTSSSTPSGGSQTPVNGSANPMTIVNFPSLYNDYTTTSRNVEVFGLSATYPSSEGMTAGLSGINTMGSIHLNYEASRSAN